MGADNYTLYISTDNASFTAISPVITGTSYASTREPDGTTPLSNGSTYYYYVVAHNAAGNSANSETVSATPVAPNRPSVPTNLSATGGTAQVSLSWTASSGVVDNYTIYFSTDNSSYSLAGDNATGTSFVHTNRDHSTLYYYYVVANNTGGSSDNSSTVSATTSAAPQLDTPGALSFTYSTGDNDDNVTVSWSAVANANLYELWYTSDNTTTPSSGGTQIDNISGTSYTIPSGISGNMKGYYYELRAKDSAGNYAPSNYRSADSYTPCRRVEVSGTGIEGAYSSSETSVTALAMTHAPLSSTDGDYIPGCSTVRLNDHVLRAKHRVTTDLDGMNRSPSGHPPGNQLIGLLMDNATAPYDASDYAYAWQVGYYDYADPTSVSIVINGAVQASRYLSTFTNENTRFGLELSADESELYLLMTGYRHIGLVTNHGSTNFAVYPYADDNQSVTGFSGAVRNLDGSPLADISNYTPNTLEH